MGLNKVTKLVRAQDNLNRAEIQYCHHLHFGYYKRLKNDVGEFKPGTGKKLRKKLDRRRVIFAGRLWEICQWENDLASNEENETSTQLLKQQ